MEPTKMEFSEHSDGPNHPETTADSASTTVESALSSSASQPPQKGIAGRINYSQWDKVTKDLVAQIDEESQQETIEEKKKVSSSTSFDIFICLLFLHAWMYSTGNLIFYILYKL